MNIEQLSINSKSLCRRLVDGLNSVGFDGYNTHWHRSREYRYSAHTEPECIFVLRNKAAQAARLAGARGNELHDIQIAVGEALSNAYKHGSPQKPINVITLRCKVRNCDIEFVVTDEGRPFDVCAAEGVTADELRESGRGMHLMSNLMDKVDISCGPAGNSVTLTKHLSK